MDVIEPPQNQPPSIFDELQNKLNNVMGLLNQKTTFGSTHIVYSTAIVVNVVNELAEINQKIQQISNISVPKAPPQSHPEDNSHNRKLQ